MSDGRAVNSLVTGKNGADMRRFMAGKNRDLISDRDVSALDLTLKAAETVIRAADPLHGHGKTALHRICIDIDLFQIGEQRRTCVPWHVCGGFCNIVPTGGGYWNDGLRVKLELCKQNTDLFADLLEFFMGKINQIHFIDCKYKVSDTHECADTCMTACLRENTVTGIHEDHSQICKGSADRHIAGVFFMPRCVCNDKGALVRREIP